MRHRYLLILAISPSAYADDPFSCVDPLVADAFLGDSYRGRGEYSTSVPEGFADLEIPAGLTLVGSQTFDSTTTVVYKASADPETSFEAAVAAMSEAGWTESEGRFRGISGGFQNRTRPSSTALCHDDHPGELSVISADKSGHTFISYVHHPDSVGCTSAARTPEGHDTSAMMRLVPTLRLPESANATNTGMGGNGDEVSSHVDISGGLGRPDLMSYFSDQIRSQGWVFQTGWSSPRSSGSVWTLESPDNGLLVGTLHLFDTGTDPLRARFSVNPVDPTKGSDRGSWSGSSN